MISVDENGKVFIEYGHGSIMGFGHEIGINEDGTFYGMYSLSSTDPHPIGADCENFENIIGKTADEIGVSVVFTFSKIESLNILIEGLTDIRNEMIKHSEKEK